MRLRGKACLVTGAGSGIGKKTAILMAKEGAQIAVLSRTHDEVDEAVREIRSFGGTAFGICADVSRADEMADALEQVAGAFGTLHVVFANAGINGVWASLEELDPEDWDETIAVNLRGTFLTLKYSVPLLKKQGGSVIVNSSVNGTRVFSNTGATAYAATKAAQIAVTKMAALELAAHRIRVNVICPGAVETDIGENTEARGTQKLGIPVEFPEGWHPLRGEPATAEQVARVVIFLASDEADHVTGTELWIDGGESLIGIKG